MTLIELLIVGCIAGIASAAVIAGNCLEAFLICLLPIGYYVIRKAVNMRKEREDLKRKDEEYAFDRWQAQKRVDREMRSKIESEVYDRHRAAQLQQMNMMHQNATQAAAAQQQAAMNARVVGGQSWTDPRASYGSDLADNIINLWAINSMMNQSSAAHASTALQGGSAIVDRPLQEPVKTDPVQFHSFVNSSSESTSSSSYSSDTSSDSFGGSDTSSDSF